MLFKPSQNVFKFLYGLICFIKRATYGELFKNSFEFCSYFILDSNVQMSWMTNIVQNWWLWLKESWKFWLYYKAIKFSYIYYRMGHMRFQYWYPI